MSEHMHFEGARAYSCADPKCHSEDNLNRLERENQQLRIAHGASYENGQRLAREVGVLTARVRHLEGELTWISVTERLPEIGQLVIVNGGVARRRGDGWFSPLAQALIQWEVKHWMPLPKPLAG